MKATLPERESPTNTSLNHQAQGQVRTLDPFVGHWTVSGANKGDAPQAPDTPVTGEETYEWLPGCFFIHARWVHRFEGGGHEGVSVLGYDPERRTLLIRNFDNLGFARSYVVTHSGSRWKFTGEQERAELEFRPDGRVLTVHWEVRRDDRWAPLCDLQLTRQA